LVGSLPEIEGSRDVCFPPIPEFFNRIHPKRPAYSRRKYSTGVNWTSQAIPQHQPRTIFNMDKTIGSEFDKGLADLKALVGK
jgi:hypothetical protein